MFTITLPEPGDVVAIKTAGSLHVGTVASLEDLRFENGRPAASVWLAEYRGWFHLRDVVTAARPGTPEAAGLRAMRHWPHDFGPRALAADPPPFNERIARLVWPRTGGAL
jgi:hypothetical protein